MNNEIMVYLPDLKIFIMAAEGSGENLSQDDIDSGSVDYTYIEIYKYEDRELVEIDGGMQLLPKQFKEMYPNVEDCLNDVMEFMTGGKHDYVVIENLIK